MSDPDMDRISGPSMRYEADPEEEEYRGSGAVLDRAGGEGSDGVA